MGELYRMRGHIEHLHENQHLEVFDRNKRIEIATMEAVSEFIARTTLNRILQVRELVKRFGNVIALQAFWELLSGTREALWSKPIDPYEVLADFKFNHTTDAQLGKILKSAT